MSVDINKVKVGNKLTMTDGDYWVDVELDPNFVEVVQ